MIKVTTQRRRSFLAGAWCMVETQLENAVTRGHLEIRATAVRRVCPQCPITTLSDDFQTTLWVRLPKLVRRVGIPWLWRSCCMTGGYANTRNERETVTTYPCKLIFIAELLFQSQPPREGRQLQNSPASDR